MTKDPWSEAKDKIKDGDKIEGEITRIKHFGAFVEVYPGVEALLPVAEISDSKIVYKSDGFVKGPFKKATFKFNDPDGLVTVRINGGDNKKTEWYFKVYCPSKKTNK